MNSCKTLFLNDSEKKKIIKSLLEKQTQHTDLTFSG